MCDQVDEEVYFTYGGSERIVTGETVVAFNLEIGADPPRARRVTVVSRHGELSTGRIAQYNPETDTGFIEIAPEFQRRIMFHSSELEETFPHPVAIGAFVAFQTRPAQGDRKSMATHVRQCGRVVKFDTKERDGLIGERICFSYQASAYREAERGRGGVASSASGPRDRARQQQQQQPQQGRGGRGGVEVLTVTPQPQSTAARESDGGGERGAVSDDPKRQVMPCRYGVDCKLYTCQFGHPDTRPKCCPSVDACDNPSCPLIHKKLMMEQGPPTMSNFLENTQGKILAIRKGVRVRACRHHPRCRAGLRCSDAHVIQEPHKRLASGGTAYRSSSNLSPRHDQQQQHSQEMVGRDTQTPAGAARGKPTALPSSQQGPGPVTASGGVAILSSVQGPRVEEGGKGRGPVIEEVGPTAGSFPPGVHSSSALSAPHPPHGERDGRDPHALPPMGPLGALMQQQGGGNTGPVIHGVRSGPSGPSGGRGIQSVSGGYGGVSPSTGGEKEKQQQQQQHQVVPVSGGMGMCGGASSRRGSWRVVVIVVDGYRWGLETGGVAEELDRLESFVLSEIGNACEDGVKTVSPRGARVFLHPDPLEVAKLQNQQKRGSGEWGDGPVTGEGGLRYIQRVKDLGWQVGPLAAWLVGWLVGPLLFLSVAFLGPVLPLIGHVLTWTCLL
uniref:C3H1-type domain-containing protein n=1 Tax=Chromera velia CCMP2878 TaxID=1169474 RepID=A0A0K6S7F7_9ALVE|eukprot:Cvel_20013.t1-p1 / transcript=Cvel_20013.t1 / gene=Cvel_20013 / organism=Chromera_velia_CCMP2878 / gene_product=hypothetical protein / transcript_product=hypothetical protein / location=Cvel_scaffold1765:16996-19005(+) / protein_length=670 / sequence_SO=supercontig / SO=protein_coding / is_pseudo=false